ncbi:MAG: TIGR02281 family clan AA aspartic protease [Gammaproteobacteria bacterium]|nr:TIGR02281 family clan AA aspartic protease [Gammaproteobacteria bacterium]MBT8150170.1 TIGR02281 family clan AA aspartic protease [Gammaproteobacteria bacterium]NND38075.1 TIGR02281 family clan AA aspartic protease [Pseudomonadales bacterium]RZV58868.1 MAG: TIGR02281 family clan AA aspartic protease [Pseudomonadales bacterium]
MFVLAWLVLLGLLAMWFNADEQRRYNPNSEPQTIDVDGARTLVLAANRNNHFVTTGQINGQPVTLLLDTGATNVAIPADMGKRLQLKRGPAGVAYTANGRVTVYATRIDRLQIGEITLQNVSADLNPGMNGSDAILLGMSALSQVQFSQRDGKLFLTQ